MKRVKTFVADHQPEIALAVAWTCFAAAVVVTVTGFKKRDEMIARGEEAKYILHELLDPILDEQ